MVASSKWLGLSSCVAAGGVGLFVAAVADQPEGPLLVLTAAALIAPLIWRTMTGRFDMFEPLVVFSGVWFAMFVVRPISMNVTGDTAVRASYDVAGYLGPALALGFLGAVCYLVAYWIGSSLRSPARISDLDDQLTIPVWLPALSGALGLVTLLLQAGQSLGGTTAYFYFAPLLLIPAALLLIGGTTSVSPRTARLWGYGLLALFSINYLLVGQRWFVLLAVTSAAILEYLSRDRRPRGYVGVLGVVVVWFTVIGVVEAFRSNSDLTGAEVVSPTQTFERFTEGPTTEMFPALALQLSTEETLWERQPGGLAAAIVTQIVPSALWASKPRSPGEEVYAALFPTEYAETKAGTALTVVGDFYYDSGLVGVIAGMMLLGIVSAMLWRWFLLNAGSAWSQVVYAPVAAFAIVTFRGNIPLILSLALFVYGPLMVAAYVGARSRRSAHTLRPSAARP